MNFKIGDKVVYNGHFHGNMPQYFPEKGTTGLVIAICNADNTIKVQWPKKTTKGRGIWWTEAKDLKLVEDNNEKH